MSYFQELDAWLTAVLLVTDDDRTEEEWFARVKKQLKDKMLESYRNGQKAGLEPAKAKAEQGRGQQRNPRTFWSRRKGQGR